MLNLYRDNLIKKSIVAAVVFFELAVCILLLGGMNSESIIKSTVSFNAITSMNKAKSEPAKSIISGNALLGRNEVSASGKRNSGNSAKAIGPSLGKAVGSKGAGNSGTKANPVSQTVKSNKVILPVLWGNRKEQGVSLTFDDGFDRKSIEKALDVLKKKGLHCTFFIPGVCLRVYPDLWKKALNDGHQICNHSNTHQNMGNMKDEDVKKEMDGWERAVSDVLGKEYLNKMKLEFPYFRLPGGNGSKNESVLGIVEGMGYVPVGWSLETYSSILKYYNLKTAPVGPVSDKVGKYLVNNTRKGEILLLHFNPYDIERLEYTIDGIKNRGFVLKPLTEVLVKS